MATGADSTTAGALSPDACSTTLTLTAPVAAIVIGTGRWSTSHRDRAPRRARTRRPPTRSTKLHQYADPIPSPRP